MEFEGGKKDREGEIHENVGLSLLLHRKLLLVNVFISLVARKFIYWIFCLIIYLLLVSYTHVDLTLHLILME